MKWNPLCISLLLILSLAGCRYPVAMNANYANDGIQFRGFFNHFSHLVWSSANANGKDCPLILFPPNEAVMDHVLFSSPKKLLNRGGVLHEHPIRPRPKNSFENTTIVISKPLFEVSASYGPGDSLKFVQVISKCDADKKVRASVMIGQKEVLLPATEIELSKSLGKPTQFLKARLNKDLRLRPVGNASFEPN